MLCGLISLCCLPCLRSSLRNAIIIKHTNTRLQIIQTIAVVSQVCYALLTKTPCNCKLEKKKNVSFCPCLSLVFLNHALLNWKFCCVNTPSVTLCVGINQSSEIRLMYIGHSLGLVSYRGFSLTPGGLNLIDIASSYKIITVMFAASHIWVLSFHFHIGVCPEPH